MRYEDTSGSISGSATPGAHDDADTLPNGSNGPATGNVITGAGTTTGHAGADTPASGHIVAIRGASGADASDSGSSLHADGRFGTLAIDEHGNYKYVADGHAPANFRDLFQYTLADSKGGRSVADLVISRGGEVKVAENAQKITPNADGTVTLPAGVDLNNVHVVGRDLVVDMPDGTQIVIVDGAVFVPQLVLGGVEVPSTNLAALLIDAEPKPAAGSVQSSGGNFGVPVPPLDPGVPLGDLIPPTDLHFTPPEFHEVNGFINHKPTIEIQPDGQPASVAAVDSVNEKGLPTRNGGEPAGSGEIADGNGANNSDTSETHGGTIIIDSQDAPNTVSINGVVVTGVIGQQIAGDFGTLTITGFSGSNILYSYTLTDNTSGDTTHDDFSVTVTDHDGDQATATLVVNIVDDVPTAHADTDSIPAGEFGPATGNVITDAAAGDAGDSDNGADVVGADNASLTAVTGFGATTAIQGGWTVVGHYGVLTINTDGSYSYTRNPGTPGGVSDVFNYTLTDGDGDTSSTTLTIDIGDATPHTGENATVLLDDDALAGGNPGGVGDDPDSANTTGNLAGGGGDGPITFAVQTTGAPAGFSYVSGGAGVVLVQQNGHTVLTVTVGSDGSYSVVQNAPIDHPAGSNENNDVFTINYNVTDQDGDSAPGSFTINVDDDTPTVGIADRGTPNLTVDESDLGTNATASFASNFEHSFGADGPAAANSLTYSLGISAPGADSGLKDVATGSAIVLVNNNGVVEGHVGDANGALAFTVSVNAAGDVTLDQIRAVVHPDANNPDTDETVTLSADNLVTLTATVTDHDGDTASSTINIGTNLIFHDDGPTAAIGTTGQTVSLDETVGVQGDSNDVAGPLAVFAGVANKGVDPDMATQFAANANAVVNSTGTVFGADGGAAVFSLNVSAAGVDSGLNTTDGHDILLTLENGIVVGRVSGGADDGKAAFAISIDSSGHISMVEWLSIQHPNTGNPDDSVSIANGAVLAVVTATDNDGDFSTASTAIGGLLSFQDDGPTAAIGTTGQTVSLDETVGVQGDSNDVAGPLAQFAGVANKGVDPNMATQFAANANAVVNSTGTAFGADGAGTAVFSLNVSAAGVDSGLNTTDGHDILLTLENGIVVGRVSGGADDGKAAFAISIDSSGHISMVEWLSIQHPNTGNPDDSLSIANGAVLAVVTVTDGDGDTSVASTAIGGLLSFQDDGPVAHNDTDVTSNITDTADGNVITGVGTTEGPANADQPGSDGFGSITNLLGFNGSNDGNPSGGFDVNGQFGTLHMDANGNYTYTRTGGSGGATDTFTYTYVDGDGDPATATLTIILADNTPVAGTVNVGLDDDALAGGNPGGIGDDPDSVNATGNLPGSGGDAPLTFGVTLAGAPAGFSYVSGGAGIVLVQQGGVTVLTVTVNSTTGAYSVVQNAPINHAAGGDENNQAFAITYTVTDSDNDVANGTINISVDDDTPTVSANAGVQLDDDALAGGNAGGIGDDPNATNTSGTLAHSYGADGAGSIAYLTTGAPAGFSYALQGNGDLWVMQGATHVLTLTVNASTGAYTVTQVAPIDHAAGLDENNVAFTISYNVTDHDGDSATGSITVNVDDDTPTVSANAAVQLDDDALAGGNAGGIGDDADSANTSGTLAHSYGADGAGSIAYLTTGAPAGFSYALQGNGDLWVMQGATHVLTLTVNASTGAYTVTQVAPIDHAAGLDENNVSFTISYNVTDHDGDAATGSITVNVDDDTPTVSANAAVQLDDDALAGGNPGGIGDDANATNVTGTLGHSFGADGAGAMAYLTTGAPAGFSYALQGNGDLWVMQGATHVLTLTLNSSTGAYSVSQVAPISHPAGGDENNVSFTISYNVTDHDGDSATGSITVNVDDDTPTATVVTTGEHVSVDESVGVQADSNDTTSGTVSALFSGVTNVGTDTDLPQYATNANAVVASTGSSYGADGAGTTVFGLNVSAAGVDSGLNTTDGHDILLFKEGNLIVGRVSGGADDGKAAFAIAIDNSGHISMVEYLSIQHADAANADDMASITNGAVLAVVTVTDADGDSASNSVAIGNQIQFQDSGPVMVSADNINIQNSGDIAATGGFHYLLGADGASADNNVLAVTGSATVNGVAVTNYVINETSENATSAVYTFSFDYPNGTGTTAHETGTLTFDKAAGTYTVDLADPISGFSLLATAGAPASAFINYNPDGTTSQGPSNIATVQLANNFFIQFTGDSAGSHTTVAPDGTFVPVTTATFANLETFTGSAATVTVSSSAAGVAGNTIQGGEVLDFNLYATDPHQNVGVPTQNATSMFIELDGVGATEDMIVVLKLYDTVTHQYTTEALMVQNGDIIKSNATLAGTPYSSIVLDNNDGLIVIEANDYQQGNSNLVIVGAQIAGSDSGVTGTAINLNGGLGATGGSSGTQAFSTDVNDNPFKIQNIGFALQTTTNQNADLTFNVTVKDGDGDSILQTIHATITQNADSATAATIPAANTTVAPVVLDLNGDGVHYLSAGAGVHYDYGHGSVATAWAAPQDGILVLDGNQDGNVSASEFVFGGNGVTDLQALAAQYGSTLDANDADFAKFAVWQDANSNGTVDAGELQSLTARGITSISLSSNGISYTTANGDVQVAGTGSYTKADGTSGVLEDAAFATESRSATNSVLMGALAAAGLAAESAAAATTTATLAATTALTGVAGQHTQSFAPVAADAVGSHANSDLMPASTNGTAHAAAASAGTHASDAGQAHAESADGNAQQQAPAELLQGTAAPTHDAPAAASAAAAAVVMPAAAQLAGADGAQHGQILGQVLADALHGGGSGPTIDSVLAALPGHGDGHAAALEALASTAGAAVSNGDTAAFAGFSMAAAHFTMEQMVVHADAAPAHA